MSDSSRTYGVLAGAAVLVAALFAPWYAVDLSAATHGALGSQLQHAPGVLGEFARQILAVLPDHIEADGWQAFERTDIVLLCAGLAAAVCALLARFDVAAIAGGVASGAVLVAMVDQPGPDEIISLKWGPWIALAGALLIVAAARLGARPPAPSPAVDRTAPVAPAAPAPADPARSVAPPAA